MGISGMSGERVVKKDHKRKVNKMLVMSLDLDLYLLVYLFCFYLRWYDSSFLTVRHLEGYQKLHPHLLSLRGRES